MIEHPLQSFLHLRRSRLDIFHIWSGGVSRQVDLGLTQLLVSVSYATLQLGKWRIK